jgi:diguanylate cyclase (GGDEF)-like protein
VGIAEEAHKRIASGESEQARYVKRYLHADGRVVFVEVSKSPARDASGKTLYYLISERDVTEERLLTAQLSHQALHDPLTGLANRALFEDRLLQAHSRVVRQGGVGAVLLLDLDDFKGVNDTHGHFVGDELLVTIARRLEQVTRSSDTLCRFGGDEFLYLAEGLSSPDEAGKIAGRLLDAFVEPFSVAGLELKQHTSLGVAIWDASSTDVSEVIQEVDVALYEAKREGKARHVVYTPGMHQQAITRYSLVQELRQALQAGELSMHFQPIVNLVTADVVGFEALMRWQHPTRGWVPPSVFIPLAEQSDLILELGAFALRESVKAATTWDTLGSKNGKPYATVNLSAHQFLDPNLVTIIEDALSATGLPAERLMIEITESVALLEVTDTLSILDHLRHIGVGVALDDFGTGYSSLSYLARLDPMIIKIDQSFVRPANKSVQNDRLLETIISLGHRLDMTMLAEGIETTDQLTRLRELGCGLGQGFLFSPGVPKHLVPSLVGKTFEV